MEADFGQVRGLDARAARLALDRVEHGRVLAADVGASPRDGVDVVVEALDAQDAAPEQAGLAGLLEAGAQDAELLGVLAAHVDDALGRAEDATRDRHPLDDRVGVLLEEDLVLEGARLALVGVADDVLGRAVDAGQLTPLAAGGVGGAAAAAHVGGGDLLDDRVRGHRHGPAQPLVAALAEVDGQLLLVLVVADVLEQAVIHGGPPAPVRRRGPARRPRRRRGGRRARGARRGRPGGAPCRRS